ncbi:transcriptional regulatory protein BtsR [Rhodoferax lithotrophicus]|uniref:Transcriptional regulatory protein BtsR n=1 Tax=Rhodoferax lithotrophicus TaxID=2798804 RepID=A0ABM7MPS5_9BURK|nr:LytTR family DNA-binding domain-containing protein [Rhodoferax sp. MIZ03]BCO28311.1 transcriptional regulatory protein BtsR [Rhodoferax sp. MIZ03]
MNQPHTPSALIAEDEPLLAAALRQELARAWPELQLLASVGDGQSAVAQALALQPDVLFLDIRMPGLSGLEAAAELMDAWPTTFGSPAFPALVFVTAYDQYALQAFDAQAVDYLLKPVQPERLKKTVSKVQMTLAAQAQAAIHTIANKAPDTSPLESTLAQLRHLLAATSTTPGTANPAIGSGRTVPAPLQHIQASVGSTIHLLPVSEVVYFEAADKYVRVLTSEREVLIRTPLKELLPQLETSFWQIHRSTVVNTHCIDSVTRDEAGKLWLHLRNRPERLAVSRLYAYLFKAM